MKKIMFNDVYGLTAAVLNGTKTQTRRIVPDKIIEDFEDKCEFDELIPQGTRDKCFKAFALQYAPFKVGEIVAIAQQYSDNAVCDFLAPNVTEKDACMIGFLMHSAGWENKMFVKSEYMPHQIKIIGVKVERLQDISDEDCLAEGIAKEQVRIEYDEPIDTVLYSFENSKSLKKYTSKYSLCGYYNTPKEAFSDLINAISGRNTWERNPFVFAYTFTLIK